MSEQTIIKGDCLEVLKTLADNSIDCVVTDPPYGISFMGKKWDYDVPSVEVWQEAMRVLKPGGHMLVACGTRTQHRMAVNIEDAGFEIRDIVAWVYGSGFPKSLNIGKAVDKLQGNEREVIPATRHSGTIENSPFHAKGITEEIPTNTKGTTEWEGWGTALKPAMELWTLARKPLSEKTVAENVLRWGTGGLNIDESRVNSGKVEKHKRTENITDAKSMAGKSTGSTGTGEYNTGRFPANLIHDGSDEVVGMFPNSKSVAGGRSTGRNFGQGEKDGGKDLPRTGHNDSGSAARFFYTAKSSKAERKYLDENGEAQHSTHPTHKPIKLMKYLIKLVTPKGGTVLDPFLGSGSTAVAAKELGYNCIGIEREEEYCEIARNRLAGTQASIL